MCLTVDGERPGLLWFYKSSKMSLLVAVKVQSKIQSAKDDVGSSVVGILFYMDL